MSAGQEVLQTARLVLRRVTLNDAAFILELVNQPSWLQYIGDKGVRTVEDARGYLEKGPLDMYARLGFGLYCVELKSSGEPLGLCGLIRRDGLDAIDIGFAFLPQHWMQGYAYESAAAVLEYARSVLGQPRVLAITSVDNNRSIYLLEALGFRFERLLSLTPGAPEVRLFSCTLRAPA